ncbi:MAG: LLM class flavin-dependent oxidoreductase [Caldilineaceae bacterium]|nr:LLM class flavin-dependent oxidoreductase [Caldilineaceae bacterium]
MSIPLSVLDLAPVATDTTAVQALHNSIALARSVDQLGYKRYWLAEHHNIPSIAVSTPEIMIARIAQETAHMRIGSGGMMLPNHAPLRVAELFTTLEALYPGRIDLGIGRAPGTDPLTVYALRQSRERMNMRDFPRQLSELVGFGQSDLQGNALPVSNPLHAIRTVPNGVVLPPIWLLGSSREFSAKLAGARGFSFAFAYHINPVLADAVAAMESYRRYFRPSAQQSTPMSLLAVSVLCADTREEVEAQATVLDLAFVRRQRGEVTPLPSLAEAQNYAFTEVEQAQAQEARARMLMGEPRIVHEQIAQLVDTTGANEIAVAVTVADHAARLRTYQLLATAFALQWAG